MYFYVKLSNDCSFVISGLAKLSNDDPYRLKKATRLNYTYVEHSMSIQVI